MEEQNQRLKTGSTPIYQRFITRTRSALSSWLLASEPTPFCLCKPFSYKACSGKGVSMQTGGGTKPAVNLRLTIGSSAVYPRFISGTRSALHSWNPDQYTAAFFVSANLANPKPGHTTSRSGRGGARQSGEAGRGRVGRDAIGSIWPGDNPPSCPPANREHCPERLFGSTNKTKSYVNRWRNEISG